MNIKKIVIINHTFQKPEFWKRWKLFSDKHDDLDVFLLAPQTWIWGRSKTLTYGRIENLKGKEIDDGNFHIHLIRTKDTFLKDWISNDMEKEILEIKPDLVYFIGGYTASGLMQLFDLRKHFNLNMKICAFTMRGHSKTIELKKDKGIKKYVNYLGKLLLLAPRVKKFNRECDAAFCHYPAALEAFRKEGYKKPIYLQTQVGVDPDIFHFDDHSRKEIRAKYHIGDAYLFGSASRFHYSKGLREIICSLPTEGNWKYLLMGWGTDEEVSFIKKLIKERGLEDKIILTGFIDSWGEMAKHWCALDCAIHFPLTTEHWEETFSLALVQAMITGLPVIGSDSGSVPYQIGQEGIIIKEGDIDSLHEKIVYMINNKEYGLDIGRKMKYRAQNCFSIYHLNDLFYETIIDIMNNKFDNNKIDMASWKNNESRIKNY